MTRPLPLPPLALAHRVGALEPSEGGPFELYTYIGEASRATLLSVLPDGWGWEGKRVLDFGCGAGRTLRHFAEEAETAHFSGCDIDVASIDWARDNLDPPFTFLVNDELPPLPLADASFDLIWSISVWTHLTDHATDWLLEMRRLLAPDGILVITFMAAGMSKVIAREEWDPDRIGMTVLNYGQAWDDGGPSVLHSPWWIREHWGRGFDVLALTDRALGPFEGSQGVVALRSNGLEITAPEIDRVEAGEPRELTALLHERRHAWSELGELRRSMAWLVGERTRLQELASFYEESATQHEKRRTELECERMALVADRDRVMADRDRLAAEVEATLGLLAVERDLQARRLAEFERSRSWRITAPLRSARALLRRHGR